MSNNIYPFPWPIGTCFASHLPAGIYEQLLREFTPGIFPIDEMIIHRTATEGPYISYAGWKVRVIVVELTDTTIKVQLA